MSKLTASRLILLSIAAPSAAVALTLGNRPNLTQHQIRLLETANQICYASTTTLISLESTRKLIKKPPFPPPKSPEQPNLPPAQKPAKPDPDDPNMT